MQIEIKLIPPDRKGGDGRLQLFQIGPHRGRASRCDLGVVLPEAHLLKHLTAVIPHPRDPKSGSSHPRRQAKRSLLRLDGCGISIVPIGGNISALSSAPTPTAPAEQTMGERHAGIPGQLVRAEPTHPLCRHGRQSWAANPKLSGNQASSWRHMGKALRLKACPIANCCHSEAVLISTQSLHPRPIDRLPSPRVAGGLQARPQRRAALHPGVQRRRRMGKPHGREALHEIKS